MDPDLFNFIQMNIACGYVSVCRYPTHTAYLVGGPNNIMLISEYSHRSADNIFVRYSLLMDGEIVESATRGVLSNDKNSSDGVRNYFSALLLETLIKQCSYKVIFEEQQALKNHMLATPIKNDRRVH